MTKQREQLVSRKGRHKMLEGRGGEGNEGKEITLGRRGGAKVGRRGYLKYLTVKDKI